VTVPAYQWLWSGHDEINHHHRRYTRRSLVRVAEQAGWELVRTTYFNSLLLPSRSRSAASTGSAPPRRPSRASTSGSRRLRSTGCSSARSRSRPRSSSGAGASPPGCRCWPSSAKRRRRRPRERVRETSTRDSRRTS
jgi:hypothetical protein